MNNPKLWQAIGFYGFIYLILMIIMVGGYGFAQQYAKPIAALIFPINEGNSLLKNVLVVSAMYWGMCGFFIFRLLKK
ncbi:MAG: hypothetical protein KTR14_08615 [Vampirovibrio sp.]|nr:hypothetical protein [Vampirovibrio sp.]